MDTLVEREYNTCISEALEIIENILLLGDCEQRSIIGLRFNELSQYTREKEKYIEEKRHFFSKLEELLAAGSEESGNKPGKTLLLSRLEEKIMLLKLQNMENMKLLNQIKAFFTTIMTVDTEHRRYNDFGRLATASSKVRSVFDRRV